MFVSAYNRLFRLESLKSYDMTHIRFKPVRFQPENGCGTGRKMWNLADFLKAA